MQYLRNQYMKSFRVSNYRTKSEGLSDEGAKVLAKGAQGVGVRGGVSLSATGEGVWREGCVPLPGKFFDF